jgi:hypothetical protein
MASSKKRREQKPPTDGMADLRVPGISAAPLGSYLITGYPRSRSAWLAALFADDNRPCYHEAPSQAHAIPATASFGLSDPGAACVYPRRALEVFAQRPILFVRRDPAEAREALERWSGMELTNWDAIAARAEWFVAQNPPKLMVVQYADLCSYAIINRIGLHLTGKIVKRARFELFDSLQIEQDIAKAVERQKAA